MSSYKQLSNQGTLLLGAGASVSCDKRRPISGAISTGHSRHRRRYPKQGHERAEQQGRTALSANRAGTLLLWGEKKLQSCESVREKDRWCLKKEELLQTLDCGLGAKREKLTASYWGHTVHTGDSTFSKDR